MTNIPAARAIIESTIKSMGCDPHVEALKEALGLMTRKVQKAPVRVCHDLTDERKELIQLFIAEGLLSDADIAHEVLGSGSGAGRVSELRNGVRT